MKNVYSEYYELNKGYEMGVYGYTPPPDGTFRFDGLECHCGTDFRTLENYKIYRECGFNMFLGQMSAHYTGEPWETSQAKMVMDRVQEAGVEKFILLDGRISRISRVKGGLIGEGKEFADEKALDAYLENCMKDYRHHPIFYGVQLVDEPYPDLFEAIGQTYRSIKRVCPTAFVQCNLNPPFFIFNSSMFPGNGDFTQRFSAYVEGFLDATGADYFMYDFYPFNPNEDGSIYRMYMRGLQISAEIARRRGVQFRIVMQSVYYRMNGAPNWRTIERADIFYQVNALLGFGAKEFSYFTYWSKTDNNIGDYYFPDGCAIMTRRGEKTPRYDYVKEANAMLHKLAPVMKEFEYLSDAHSVEYPCKSRPMFLIPFVSKELKNVKSFLPDREVAIVSEMYDEKKDRYLYRVMNATDPYYGKDSGEQITEIQFDEKFRYADVFTNGEWKTVELVDGKYQAKLLPGFADYLIVY